MRTVATALPVAHQELATGWPVIVACTAAALRRRALLLRGKPQFSMAPCFPVYPASHNQPKAARNAL